MKVTPFGILMLIGSLFASCGQKPTAGGQCELKCGNAKIGSSDYLIKPLGSAGKVICSADSPKPIIVEATFGIFTPDAPDSSVGTKEISVAIPNKVPVGGVAFRPVIFSGSSKYTSIATPDSELCTDTCGVALVQIAISQCVAHTLEVGIQSGAATPGSYSLGVEVQ